jgi:spore coat assembly protein
MKIIKVGDIVTRQSHGGDIAFKVVSIANNERGQLIAYLKGLYLRLYADAPITDIKRCDADELVMHQAAHDKLHREVMTRVMHRRGLERAEYESRAGDIAKKYPFFDVPGKVLHLDGDQEYLKMCLKSYMQLNVPVVSHHVAEEHQPAVVVNLLKEHHPDILVLTGHDAMLSAKDCANISHYRNSKYFVEAVKAARQFEPSRDDLVIFAGACQSHFEGIINAGANFASSPTRILIHCYDPVFIAEKVAFTPISDTVSIREAITASVTGVEGVGGVETRGRFRLGLPKPIY